MMQPTCNLDCNSPDYSVLNRIRFETRPHQPMHDPRECGIFGSLQKEKYTTEGKPNMQTLQSGAATCSESFVKCFLRVLCTGRWGNTAAAVLPMQTMVGLWNSQKTLHKTFRTICHPRLYAPMALSPHHHHS